MIPPNIMTVTAVITMRIVVKAGENASSFFIGIIVETPL
jgi:hypothetical protein